MVFLSILPRTSEYLKDKSNGLPLRVERGVDLKPNLNINVTDLNKGYKHFYNGGSKGVSFKITVVIHRDDLFDGKRVLDLLDSYMRDMTPLMLYSEAIDIPARESDYYIITDNGSRKQTLDHYTKWELEFMTYNPATVYKFKNNNKGVKKAIKKSKLHTYQAKLAKCDYKKLKPTKSKKPSKAVKVLEKVLYTKGYLKKKKKVDGVFDKQTKNAIKKFQKDYNKKHKKDKKLKKKLKTNGKIDKATFKALT